MKIKFIYPARKPEWKENFWDFRTIPKIVRWLALSVALLYCADASASFSWK